METYVKFSLENVKLFLAPGSSFQRVYPRKGFDRALARFARNLEVSLNNPRQTSYVEPEDLNKSDKLTKNTQTKKRRIIKILNSTRQTLNIWKVYLTPANAKLIINMNVVSFFGKVFVNFRTLWINFKIITILYYKN